MNSYSNLPDINTLIPITVELQPIGNPCVDLIINHNKIDYSSLTHTVCVTDFCKLMDSITVSLILSNKHYTTEYETAVVIKRLSIDNIDIIPQYAYLADYQNDHNNTNPTNYLGFNGKWTLTIDRPFYQWLHQVQGQGWLLT